MLPQRLAKLALTWKRYSARSQGHKTRFKRRSKGHGTLVQQGGVRVELKENITKTINLIWLSIGLSALLQLIKIWINSIQSGEFIFSIIFISLICILPYKISQGSNAARYVYSVFVAIGIIFLISGINDKLTRLDVLFSFITVPLDMYIVVRLFNSETSKWFSEKEMQ